MKSGTCTPREERILTALVRRPHSRHELGGIVGALNVPEHVSQLRKAGWAIKCDRIDLLDRDGRRCRPGVYRFASDYELARAEEYLKSRAPGTTDAASEGPFKENHQKSTSPQTEVQDAS